MNLLLTDVSEAERRNRVEQTKSIDTQLNNEEEDDDIIFFTGSKCDISMINALVKMTESYSSLESWDAVKNSLEYGGPKLFTEENALVLIHNANKNFPNENDNITFLILSVVSICVNEILNNPYKTLVCDDYFTAFFYKLADCITGDFEMRSILTMIDIFRPIINTYNPTIVVADSIPNAFSSIQKGIIELVTSGSFSEFAISLMIPMLDKMIILTNEDDIYSLFEFFTGLVDPDQSESISEHAIEACLHLFTQFPNLYELIIHEPYEYIKDLIALLTQEYSCIKYAAQILFPLLSSEQTISILIELDVCPALLEAFTRLIISPNTNSYYLLEDITAICEISENGCQYFMQSKILEIPILASSPFKITKLLLRIIYASLFYQIFPTNEITLQLAITSVEKCLDSEDPDIIVKALKVVRFLHDQEIEIIDDVKEFLIELSFSDFGEEISNDAASLIELIKEE